MQAQRIGSYELIRQLGEGGMAQVYLARDIRLGREVAVKVLDQHLATQPGFRERFLREARVAAALDHPNIVPLYDFGESDYLWYLVMPYVSGGSLQDILRRAPLPVGEVVTYGAQIADALDYAHKRHVVHRDVKPANMLIHADGRVMLSDFGLAKILDKSARSATPRGHPDAGTPEYMAPEQIEGRTDERADIYGLGVVLYLLLTGHLPFTGSTSNVVMEGHLYRLPEQPRTLNPAVTPAVQAVVLRALAKHPNDRYQRASDLGAALLGALVAGNAEPFPFDIPASTPSRASHPPMPTVPPGASAAPRRSSAATPGYAGYSGAGHTSDVINSTLPRLDVVVPSHATQESYGPSVAARRSAAPQAPGILHSSAQPSMPASPFADSPSLRRPYSPAYNAAHDAPYDTSRGMPYELPYGTPSSVGGIPVTPATPLPAGSTLYGTIRPTAAPQPSLPAAPSLPFNQPPRSLTNAPAHGMPPHVSYAPPRLPDVPHRQHLWPWVVAVVLLVALVVLGILLSASHARAAALTDLPVMAWASAYAHWLAASMRTFSPATRTMLGC